MFPLNQSQAYCARLFLDDYKACRNHFREIIRTKKQLESRHEIFSNSVNNLDYDCDAFYLGKQDARKVMVFISGTHGIEGFCGSAIQRYLLTEIFPTLESNDDCAFLFIHALNPWGMANYRRCDELGIDLNRNFIDFNLVFISNIEHYYFLCF